MFSDELLEKCAEAVHKAYCNYYLKNKGKEYWTKGNYSLLDEPTKQIDRETVKAVFKVLKDNRMDGCSLAPGLVTGESSALDGDDEPQTCEKYGRCEFYPTAEEETCVCGAGSDVSGTSQDSFTCSAEYSRTCQYANELREGFKKKT